MSFPCDDPEPGDDNYEPYIPNRDDNPVFTFIGLIGAVSIAGILLFQNIPCCSSRYNSPKRQYIEKPSPSRMTNSSSDRLEGKLSLIL